MEPEFRFSLQVLIGMDDMSILIIESSLVHFTIVDIESSTHLSDGASITLLDVVRSEMLGHRVLCNGWMQ